jgi:hypothetical protein
MFPKIKSILKGRIFQDIGDIKQKNVTTAVETILKQEFQKYFQQWQAASLG